MEMNLPEEQQALELAQRITDFSDELVLLLSLKERWADLKKEVDSIFFDEKIEIIPPVETDPSLLKNLAEALEPKKEKEAPEQKKRRGRPPKNKTHAKMEQEFLNQSKASEDI